MEEEAGWVGVWLEQSSQGFHMALSFNLQFGLRAERVSVSHFGPEQCPTESAITQFEDQQKIGKGQLGG